MSSKKREAPIKLLMGTEIKLALAKQLLKFLERKNDE